MQPIAIVPAPESVTAGEGWFDLREDTVIAAPDDQRSSALLLQGRLRPSTGWLFPVVRESAAGGDTHGEICLVMDESLGASGYTVEVTPTRVKLAGGDGAGLFHATQVFLQLCPTEIFRRTPLPGTQWRVPVVAISDKPRFAWRGMLLDVSRHYFGRDSVLTLIDVLALHRMNVLHLHLTDDQGWRVEIRRYPRLTSVGSWRARSAIDRPVSRTPGALPVYDHAPHNGFFTQQDLREIVAYAAARFITVMPEIDLPGHSQAAIASYPHLGNTEEQLPVWTDWGINTHVLNVEDSTIEFYENVLEEVMEIFPSTYIHIGGDECPKDEWRASSAAQARMRELGLQDEDGLQSWMIRSFARFLSRHGRRAIGWDEILEGGLPEDATVMSWRGVDGGIAAAEAGHDVVMTPDPEMYLYHRQSEDPGSEPMAAEPPFSVPLRTVYDYEPVPASLSAQARTRVLGAQCQMWTEFVSSERQMHQLVFPRMCAFAEAVWRSTTSQRSFDDFQNRMVVHDERLRVMGIDGYHAPGERPTLPDTAEG